MGGRVEECRLVLKGVSPPRADTPSREPRRVLRAGMALWLFAAITTLLCLASGKETRLHILLILILYGGSSGDGSRSSPTARLSITGLPATPMPTTTTVAWRTSDHSQLCQMYAALLLPRHMSRFLVFLIIPKFIVKNL